MDRALEMVNESKKQIERMDIFVETMRKMSSLDTKGVSGRRNYK